MASGQREDEVITIALVDARTGESEPVPFPPSATLRQVAEVSAAIFGLAGNPVRLFKDGRPLPDGDGSSASAGLSLAEAGISNGDMIAVQQSAAASPPAGAAAASSSPSAAAGLDFSRLLAGGAGSSGSTTTGGGGGGLDFGNLLGASAASSPSPAAPVYYPGMNLQEATAYNRHPETFITLFLSKEHLQKELNYYNPRLAAKLHGQSKAEMVRIWREELVKGGIQGAVEASSKLLRERQMQERKLENPNDPEVIEYYASIERKAKVNQQYEQMMQEYPESLGRVLMLYVGAKINGHDIQAFCDSGAQSTIMSKRTAVECDLFDYVDTRFHGTAVGVGTGKILGRIHLVQLQVGPYHFPCSVTVMDDPPPGASEMPFLLGLDMMKRHQCVIDLGRGVLKFRLGGEDYHEAPFLHEKDLDESQGGTRGFDAAAANQKVLLELEDGGGKTKKDG